MFTLSKFTSEWQRRHHPSANVEADAAFYYRLYCQLHGIAERNARNFCEADMLTLLLYAENTIAVGLDGVYEYMYRSLGDVVSRWCGGLGMAGAVGQVSTILSEAVAEAPCSTLRRWMAESVVSPGFRPLSDMLTWLAREDKVLRRVFPDLRYRKAMFLRLAGDRKVARQMLWADMAFNWRDKRGCSLPQTLARLFSQTAASAGGDESQLLRQAAGILSGISSERLDVYSIVRQADGRTFALRRADGCLFSGVALPGLLAGAAPGSLVAAQLAIVRGKAFVNGPASLLADGEAPCWHGPTLWNAIEQEEQAHARRTTFTTPFGKSLSLYDDLYTRPNDPAEAYLADCGIYPDEPTILDFIGGAASCCTPA